MGPLTHRRATRRTWVPIIALSASLLGLGATPTATSADCFYGPAWPSLDRARGTTFVGIMEGWRTIDEDGSTRPSWTVERVYAGDLEPGPLDAWGSGRPSCHPLVLREGVRYLISSSYPGGGDAFTTLSYEMLGQGRVRLASFPPQQPRRSAPAAYRVDTMREALALLLGELPPTDTISDPPDTSQGPSPSAEPSTPPIDPDPMPVLSWMQAADDDETAGDRLFVGTGDLIHEVVSEGPLSASGPVDGQVLVQTWPRPGRTVLTLFDTSDGSGRVILRTNAPVGTPTLSPDGAWAYWLRSTDDTHLELWRRAIPDGERQRVMGSRTAQHASLSLSAEGRWAAIDSTDGVIVVDTRTGRTSRIADDGAGQEVIGFLGREVVMYRVTTGHERAFPISAVDPRDGTRRVLVEGPGGRAAILRGPDGSVLVWEERSDDRYRLWMRGLRDPAPRLLHERILDGPSWDGGLVVPGWSQGIEAPGYAAVLSCGRARIVDQVGRCVGGGLLVSLTDGSIIDVPAPTPWPTASPSASG